MTTSSRFDRNERFFGKEGQEILHRTHCAIIGVGGLGTHIVQQLAYLGVGHLTLVDNQDLDDTNRNRYVGSRHTDPIPGSRKVDLAERLVKEIDLSIVVHKVHDTFISPDGYAAIQAADYVFGCLDLEGARLILNEICSVYERRYFDLASEISPPDPPGSGSPDYGGRVFANLDGIGCLVCTNVLDMSAASEDLRSESDRRTRDDIYGLKRNQLGSAGPSVVSINGIIASLAVTEFMLFAAGIRPANRHLNYNGRSGKVAVRNDNVQEDCWYCVGLRGKPQLADVEQHIRSGLGERLR